MANLNKVILIGNLTNDPSLRQKKSGKVDVVVWNKLAEACSQYLRKGKLVFIEGRLQYRTWEEDGNKRSKHEVQAGNIQFLSPPERKESYDAHN